jgi:methylmalonyl-CoA mutase
VLQRLDHSDPAAAHVQALEDSRAGADGLILVGAGALGAYGFGIPRRAETAAVVLDQVECAPGRSLELDVGDNGEELARGVAALVRRRGAEPAKLDIRFGLDPLGGALLKGGFSRLWNEVEHGTCRLVEELSSSGFRRSLLVADGRLIHAAGGTEAHELAYVIAAGVAMLRMLERAGIAADDGRRLIFFRLAADANQFLTTVKFRALRQLWRRVETACGLEPQAAFLSAETAWRTMTRHAPAMNIVRATLAVFAAGIGGADAISVLPFTAASGLADAFARRVARNTQLVLLDEANVARVADPAAGTGWAEELTGKLCRAAWALFQEIERCGGAAAALERGLIQARVEPARSAREQDVATCKETLVGSNEFPDLGELTPQPLAAPASPLTPRAGVTVPFTPLLPTRLAQPYEELRDNSDRILAITGSRPTVLLVCLEPLSEATARIDFARNFLAAGGIDATTCVTGEIERAMKGTTKLACISGTDEQLAKTGAPAAKTLAATGAIFILATTRPTASLRAAGVQEFLWEGSEALRVMRAIQSRWA